MGKKCSCGGCCGSRHSHSSGCNCQNKKSHGQVNTHSPYAEKEPSTSSEYR